MRRKEKNERKLRKRKKTKENQKHFERCYSAEEVAKEVYGHSRDIGWKEVENRRG